MENAHAAFQRMKTVLLGDTQSAPMVQNCIIGVCFFAAAGLMVGGGFNAAMGMPAVTVAGTLFLGLVFSAFYYLARFKGVYAPLFWPVLTAACLVLILLWIYNAGISGPALVWAPIAIASAVVIGNGSQKILGPLILVATMYLLLALEYTRPGIITGYPNRLTWFEDTAITLTIAAILTAYLAGFLLSSYLSQRRRAEESLARLEAANAELIIALSQVKTLSGLLPVCADCKRVREDDGNWRQIDEYIHEHSNASVSHGICPVCADRLYPDLAPGDTPESDGQVL